MRPIAREKTLVVGLDVGDGRLLREWAEEGRLPNLRRLIAEGCLATAETPAETLHISGWPSLYTGALPGEHGVYYTFQPAPGRQGWTKFQGDQYGRPTFWSLLSAAGVRCTVFDAPYTHPESGSTATQIIDWGSWAPYWKPESRPPDLLRRLNREVGRHPLGFHALDVGMNALDPEEMRRKLVPAARARTDAARWLMAEREWDLFFVVYGESHAAAHYCWGREEALAGVYREIDAGIGALLQAAGPGASLYVVSGDGVASNHAGWHLLPDVLRRLGYLSEPEAGQPGGGPTPPARRSLDPVKLVRDLLPKDLRKAIARRLLPDALRHKLAERVDTAAIDWGRTRAFCLPTDLEGLIRINLRGREPQGIVAPGEEARRVSDELAAELGRLINPATGRAAVRAVVRADQAFPGPRRGYLPDLIVLWHAEAPIEALASPAIGTVSGRSPDQRPGTHVPPGFVLRHGPAAARRAGGAEHMCGVAPELLRHYGVPVPDYMGGRS